MASLGALLVFILGATLFSFSNACDTCNNHWTFVYEHDSDGERVSGDRQALFDAQVRGARIRYVIRDIGSHGYAEQIDTSLVYDDVLCGESTVHVVKNTWDQILDDGQWRFVIVCSDGSYEEYQYSVGAHILIDETFSALSIKWFIQESTCRNPVYAHSRDGLRTAGSKDELFESVLSGYDIKTRVNEDFIFPMNNIEVHYGDIVTGQNIWTFYSIFGIEWWFQMFSSNGLTDGIVWNVGEHVSYDHSDYQEAIDWLVEPCWRHVFTNDDGGAEIDGSLPDLVAAVERGQRVKIIIGSFSVELDNVMSDSGQVSGQILSGVSRSADGMKFNDDTSWVWQMVNTNGLVSTSEYRIGTDTSTGYQHSSSAIRWFVDTRRWKKVLSTDENGAVTFGSKSDLSNAIGVGSSVRVGLKFAEGGDAPFDSDTWFFIKAENVEFGPDGDISAELIKSVSTVKTALGDYVITSDPFWRFMVVSTNSDVDFSLWRVGVHTNDGQLSEKANVDWFVNF